MYRLTTYNSVWKVSENFFTVYTFLESKNGGQVR